MDHVSTLGGTIESIAWQKAGIFKVPVHALSVTLNAVDFSLEVM